MEAVVAAVVAAVRHHETLDPTASAADLKFRLGMSTSSHLARRVPRDDRPSCG